MGGDIEIETFTWDTILNISTTWNIDAGGYYSIVVKLIPMDSSLDEKMSNNEATREKIYVLQKADFIIKSEDISVDPSKVFGLTETFKIAAKVTNNGDSTVRNVKIGFYLGEPAVGGKLLSEVNVDPFRGKEEKIVEYEGHPMLIPLEEGSHKNNEAADHKNIVH
jgi:hypothetical protein